MRENMNILLKINLKCTENRKIMFLDLLMRIVSNRMEL